MKEFEYTERIPIRFNGGSSFHLYINEYDKTFTAYAEDTTYRPEIVDYYVEVIKPTRYYGDIILPPEPYYGRGQSNGPGAVIIRTRKGYMLLYGEGNVETFEIPEEILGLSYNIDNGEVYNLWFYTHKYVIYFDDREGLKALEMGDFMGKLMYVPENISFDKLVLINIPSESIYFKKINTPERRDKKNVELLKQAVKKTRK